MPTRVKSTSNMSKHLTQAEREAREEQENRLPDRKLTKPKILKDDKPATAHWTRILRNMQGLGILDSLDADMLGIYCTKLARRDELQALYLTRRASYAADGNGSALKDMLSISESLRSIERDLMAYANNLGLTPESRARLAKRLAEQEEADPDADLYA